LYDVTVRVTDNGSPPLDDAKTLTIFVAGSRWQNQLHPCDVTGDGLITPQDALVLINEVNIHGGGSLAAGSADITDPPPFLDPSGDGELTPFDVLFVTNYLNAFGSGPAASPSAAEGEPAALGWGHPPAPNAAAARLYVGVSWDFDRDRARGRDFDRSVEEAVSHGPEVRGAAAGVLAGQPVWGRDEAGCEPCLLAERERGTRREDDALDVLLEMREVEDAISAIANQVAKAWRV
jgi:hypothetical protein